MGFISPEEGYTTCLGRMMPVLVPLVIVAVLVPLVVLATLVLFGLCRASAEAERRNRMALARVRADRRRPYPSREGPPQY